MAHMRIDDDVYEKIKYLAREAKLSASDYVASLLESNTFNKEPQDSPAEGKTVAQLNGAREPAVAWRTVGSHKDVSGLIEAEEELGKKREELVELEYEATIDQTPEKQLEVQKVRIAVDTLNSKVWAMRKA